MPLTRIKMGMVKSLEPNALVRVGSSSLVPYVPEEDDISEIESAYFDPTKGVLKIRHYNGVTISIPGFITPDAIPTGPVGPQGLAGADGRDGKEGRMGRDGAEGCEGEQGLIGQTGPKGATGWAGPQGPVGPTGPQGPQGPTGPTGPRGLRGPQGVQGERGEDGPIGEPGLPGQESFMNVAVSLVEPPYKDGFLWINPLADYGCVASEPRRIINEVIKAAPIIYCEPNHTVDGTPTGATEIHGTYKEITWNDGVVETTNYDYGNAVCIYVPPYIISREQVDAPEIPCPDGQTVGGIEGAPTVITGTFWRTEWSDGKIEETEPDYGDKSCAAYVVSIETVPAPEINCPPGQTVGGKRDGETKITGTRTKKTWSDGVVEYSDPDYGGKFCEVVPEPQPVPSNYFYQIRRTYNASTQTVNYQHSIRTPNFVTLSLIGGASYNAFLITQQDHDNEWNRYTVNSDNYLEITSTTDPYLRRGDLVQVNTAGQTKPPFDTGRTDFNYSQNTGLVRYPA